jgi:hypothetical protein
VSKFTHIIHYRIVSSRGALSCQQYIHVVNESRVAKNVGCHVVNGCNKVNDIGHHVAIERGIGLLVSHLLTFIIGASRAVEYLASMSWIIDEYFQSLSKQ